MEEGGAAFYVGGTEIALLAACGANRDRGLAVLPSVGLGEKLLLVIAPRRPSTGAK
jgi:hypothetical protein